MQLKIQLWCIDSFLSLFPHHKLCCCNDLLWVSRRRAVAWMQCQCVVISCSFNIAMFILWLFFSFLSNSKREFVEIETQSFTELTISSQSIHSAKIVQKFCTACTQFSSKKLLRSSFFVVVIAIEEWWTFFWMVVFIWFDWIWNKIFIASRTHFVSGL